MEAWTEAQYSVLLVRVLLSEMRRHGVDEKELLNGSGLDEVMLADIRSTVSATAWEALLERAVDASGDDALGISIAEHWSQNKLPFLGQLFAACRTLRDAYAMFERYKPLLGNSLHWTLEERDTLAYFYCEPIVQHPLAARVAFEASLGAVVRFSRSFLCVDGGALEVLFKHARPHYHAQYSRVFDCSVRFAQARYAIVAPREYLDRPQVLDDATTRAVFQRGADHVLKMMCAGSAADRVRGVLWFETDLSAIQSKSVATRVGMTVRELRRRLTLERVRLDQLLDEARLRIARRALTKPGTSLKQVSYALGFSEASAFVRAFKRWGGQTVTEYLRDLHGATWPCDTGCS